MSWFSLVIGQNASRQLATSSENLVASAQVLVALATSESQFRALYSDAGLVNPHYRLTGRLGQRKAKDQQGALIDHK